MFQKQKRRILICCILIGAAGAFWLCHRSNISTEEVKEIFLPDVEKQQVVLDLESGELVDVQCTGQGDWFNPDFAQAVKELKTGDILFELTHLVLITDAYKAAPVKDYTIWPTWHKFPRFLPYAMVITTDKGQAYNINVLEKSDDGVLLLYRRTSKDAEPQMLLAEHRDEQLLRQLLSANMLHELNWAISIYAGNEDKFPRTLDTLHKLEHFSEQDVQWINENIEYPGDVTALTVAEKTVLAYDKTLLNAPDSKGTYVLYNYNDPQIVFHTKEELKELGIK